MTNHVRSTVFFTAYQGRWSWEDRASFTCAQEELLTEGQSRVSDWMDRRNRIFGDRYTQARIISVSWCDDNGFWHEVKPEPEKRWVQMAEPAAQAT